MKKRTLTTLFSISALAGLTAVVAPIAASCSTNQPTTKPDNNNNGTGDNQQGGGTGGNGEKPTGPVVSETQINELNQKTAADRAAIFKNYIKSLKANGDKSVWNSLICTNEFVSQMLTFISSSLDVNDTNPTENQITSTQLSKINGIFKNEKIISLITSIKGTNDVKDKNIWGPSALEFNDSYSTTNNGKDIPSWDVLIQSGSVTGLSALEFQLYLTSNVDLKFAIEKSQPVVQVSFINNSTEKAQKSKLLLKKASDAEIASVKDIYFQTSKPVTLPFALFSSKNTNFGEYLKANVLPK